VELAEQANQTVAGRDPVLLAELAAAYAEAGRFSDAISTAGQAISMTSKMNTGFAHAVQVQLAAYESGHSFRDPNGVGPAADRGSQ
jgi:hypothetical protein